MLEIRNTVTEMKNDFGVPISKLNMSEDRIGELEGSSTETTQTKIQRKKNEKKKKDKHARIRGQFQMWFSSVQLLSRVRLFATPWTTARQASLSITNSQSPPKPMFHRVGDAMQPSHPLSSPSPPALSLSQHQGLFKWVSCPHQVDKVLVFQVQHQSLQWTPRTDLP